MPILVIPNKRLRNILTRDNENKFLIPSFIILRDVVKVHEMGEISYSIITLDSNKKRYSMFSIDRTSRKPIVLKSESDSERSYIFQADFNTYFPLTQEKFEKVVKALGSDNAFV
jgi:hypothetical protein